MIPYYFFFFLSSRIPIQQTFNSAGFIPLMKFWSVTGSFICPTGYQNPIIAELRGKTNCLTDSRNNKVQLPDNSCPITTLTPSPLITPVFPQLYHHNSSALHIPSSPGIIPLSNRSSLTSRPFPYILHQTCHVDSSESCHAGEELPEGLLVTAAINSAESNGILPVALSLKALSHLSIFQLQWMCRNLTSSRSPCVIKLVDICNFGWSVPKHWKAASK